MQFHVSCLICCLFVFWKHIIKTSSPSQASLSVHGFGRTNTQQKPNITYICACKHEVDCFLLQFYFLTHHLFTGVTWCSYLWEQNKPWTSRAVRQIFISNLKKKKSPSRRGVSKSDPDASYWLLHKQTAPRSKANQAPFNQVRCEPPSDSAVLVRFLWQNHSRETLPWNQCRRRLMCAS